ncbi:hypothetical protein GGS20DRAFT_78567 [Poronia punctata]|nr:hypothetical protein GGS20DRAFT_78567 [Poronia punctata]
MASEESQCVLLPMKLDAFVFNEAVCSGEADEAKIAPITQPNYTFLRLDSELIENDVLDHAYLGHSSPATDNSRYTNLATGKPWPRRQGVYLHWMLPRAYRSGKQSSDDPDAATGYPDTPTRWLVIRKVQQDTIRPETAKSLIKPIDAWVIESDRQWELDDLGPWMDLQVDVSPFISGGAGADAVDIDEQAEVFIGIKSPAWGWKESLDQHPRIQLSLLNSSNPLFPDYQPHNSNVFSMVDNLTYDDGTEWKVLESVKADYFVLGWHSVRDKDLFCQPEDNSNVQHADLLKSLMMTLKDPKDKDPWLSSNASTTSICHGSMYDVAWNATKKPANVPADDISRSLIEDMPVAVGTTPLDALMAWVTSSYQKRKEEGDEDDVISDLERILLHIETLLHAHDDGVDSQIEAADQVYNWNYSRHDGGSSYRISTTEDAGDNYITKDDLKALKELNAAQAVADLAMRALEQTRWELFSTWWKVVGDDKPNNTSYSAQVDGMLTRIQSLMDLAQDHQRNVRLLLSKGNFKQTTHDPFHQQRDPTLLVGNVESGWPWDYLDSLAVRLESQTVSPSASLDPIWDDLVSVILPKLPSDLQNAASALVKEFAALSSTETMTLEGEEVLPLYHDHEWTPDGDDSTPWRDRWGDKQPWFPLFIEWEVEYTHIPFEYWSLDERSARLAPGKKLRSGIIDGVTLYEKAREDFRLHEDRRIISGRSLILPQATFSLKSKVAQVLEDTPEDVLKKMKIGDKERKLLETSLYLLPFLSSPMSGFNEHLATRVQGTHIKPNNRTPDKPGVTPISTATRKLAGFNEKALGAMNLQTDPTPYGFLADFLKAEEQAFKPVVHGQFRFTRLNIFDKFGQAVHLLDPNPRAGGPPPLYPCISEYYEPQLVKDTDDKANTVREDLPGKCEFVQSSMYINQPARLNAEFVVLEKETNHWRPINPDDHDGPGPIFGWAVLNNADNGVQFFLPDGTFYREVRFAGRNGPSVAPRWYPFGPSTKGGPAAETLDRLIDKIQNVDGYMDTFTGMLVAAQAKLPAPPSAFSQYLNSLVGQPLALVYLGWSLELAENAYASESSLEGGSSSKPMTLLDVPGAGDRYHFPIKLGDRDRAYDGLVAFFKTVDSPTPGNELDFGSFYTYFDEGDESSGPSDSDQEEAQDDNPLKIIGNDNYLNLEAFWLDPASYVAKKGQTEAEMAAKLSDDRADLLTVVGAVMSPFVPVHASTSTLPVKTIKLPTWTWQSALSKMTAFFHMGPAVIPIDVPSFQTNYALSDTYDLSKDIAVPNTAVQVSTMGSAPWNWLQPYWAKEPEENISQAVQGGQAEEQPPASQYATRYMALNPAKAVDGKPRFERGPYVAIEGFLQLKMPLLKETQGINRN